MGNHRGIICVVAGIWLFVSISGCLDEENVRYMTLKEFLDDAHEQFDNTTKVFYEWYEKTLDDGDTVIIKDNITNVRYNGERSWIDLESKEDYGLPVEGDIRFTLMVGDTVEITLHIIKVTFITNEIGDEPVTVELETIKEGWDSINNTLIPIPQENIRVVK